MQVTTFPNPVSTRSASAAAQPFAPANGAFGATLAASITHSAPLRSTVASEKKPAPKSDPGFDARANSNSDGQSEVQAGVQSGTNTGAKYTPKARPQSGVPFASQPAPKSRSKSGTNLDSDPHPASNNRPQVTDPSVTAPVPQAANNIAVAIDNLPLPTQLLVIPLPEPAAVAVGAIPDPPTSQLAAAAPMSSDDANSEVNAAAISLGMPKPNLSVPGGSGADANSGAATAQQFSPFLGTDPTPSEFSAAASPGPPRNAGADSAASLAAAQVQFPSQLSGSAAQTVEASSTKTPPPSNSTVAANDTVANFVSQAAMARQAPASPVDATQQASGAPSPPGASAAVASSPTASQPNAKEAGTLRTHPPVRVFSFSSSAPVGKSPVPDAKSSPVSDATSATQPASQKSDRPANAEIIPSAKTSPVSDATRATQPPSQKADIPANAEIIPSAKPSPVSDATRATQPPSQKADRPANPEIIQPPLRIPQDSAPSATASSDTGTPVPSQTPTTSEAASLNSAPPAAPNPNDAPPGRDTVDAQQAAVTNRQTVPEPAAKGTKKIAALPPDAVPFRGASRTSVSDEDAGVAVVTPPSSAAPESASPAKPNQTSELPKTQQMLDSAPLAPATPTNLHLTPAAADDIQMHVGIRTTAFGTVEIHTTVIQNQVGIALHGDHGLAHWFNSEVPNLESGLQGHRLNLTAVDFGGDRSGVQTATSFQHGQPRQNSSQTTGSPAAFGDQDAAPEASTTELLPSKLLPSDLSVRPAGSRVNIRV